MSSSFHNADKQTHRRVMIVGGLFCAAFVLISFFAIFNIHLRLRASAGTTTQLARALAITSATSPNSQARSPNSGPPAQSKH